MNEFFCPHCSQHLVHTASETYPLVSMRCSSCRLIIAAGRATATVSETVSTGTAAGALGGAARRSEANAVPVDVAIADLRTVAANYPAAENRLRMIDYDAAQKRGEVTVTLAEIFATFGSWKTAASHLSNTAATGPSARSAPWSDGAAEFTG